MDRPARKPYRTDRTDLTDDPWDLLATALPPAKSGPAGSTCARW